MAVSTTSPALRTNFTWLPFWLISKKPARCKRRLISRNDSGLSRPNLDLDRTHGGWTRRPRRLEVQFEGLFQVCQCLFFGGALTGDIHFEALRHVPVAFAPDRCGKGSLHAFIVSQSIEKPNTALRDSKSNQPFFPVPDTAALTAIPTSATVAPEQTTHSPAIVPAPTGLNAASRPTNSPNDTDPK
jgi:hypothetical protein